jgi:hypothetical protein
VIHRAGRLFLRYAGCPTKVVIVWANVSQAAADLTIKSASLLLNRELIWSLVGVVVAAVGGRETRQDASRMAGRGTRCCPTKIPEVNPPTLQRLRWRLVSRSLSTSRLSCPNLLSFRCYLLAVPIQNSPAICSMLYDVATYSFRLDNLVMWCKWIENATAVVKRFTMLRCEALG